MEEVAHAERDAVAGERALGVGARVVRDRRAHRERDLLRARGLEQRAQRAGRVRADAVVAGAGGRRAGAAHAMRVGAHAAYAEAAFALELEFARLLWRMVTVAALRALLYKKAAKGITCTVVYVQYYLKQGLKVQKVQQFAKLVKLLFNYIIYFLWMNDSEGLNVM